jgi:predicted methyltransferase
VEAGIALHKDGKNGGSTKELRSSINQRLVELAEIKSGQRVLDVAKGIGEPAITAARQDGRKGHFSWRSSFFLDL